MPHRRDIDGLRAIAVLSVVFFHLGFSRHLGGGFVGVDVFFVISGYLITGILQSDIDKGRLSIAEFYNRRVRRIFPALFLVYAFCLVASAVLLYPTEAKDTGREVLYSLGFVSNVHFAQTGGYFDQASKVALLLHTWSLSVEEQFYIALPLLLMTLSRVRPRVRVGILFVLAVLSFGWAERMVALDARRAFYLLQYRAWELLCGSLLALGLFPRLRQRVLAEAVGLIGVGLILFAVLTIQNNTPFPGYWALPPCIGAMAVLHSGADQPTFTARLLGIAPLRWIGLISYSLYLWHWPIIALINARHDAMTTTLRVAILLGTLAVSALSYRYVERPFRERPYRRSAQRTLLIASSGVALVALLAFALPAAAKRLKPQSLLVDNVLSYLAYDNNAEVRVGTCFLSSGFNDAALFRKDLCLKTHPGRKNLLIVGDSHAAHFVPAFRALHPELDVLQATASGCAAVHGGYGAKRCTNLFAYIFDEFLPGQRVDTIVLAGRWPRGTLPGLKKTIAYLQPLAGRVVVLGPVVEYDQPFPRLLAQSITDGDPSIFAKHLVPAQRTSDRLFARQLGALGANYFSTYEATCPADECTIWASPGVPMQFDEHHLTLRGAELVLERFGPGLLR